MTETLRIIYPVLHLGSLTFNFCYIVHLFVWGSRGLPLHTCSRNQRTCGINSPLLTCGSWASNSDSQAW
ncbi:mCG147370 [Mus musculus]|nr:mCG147370 [Mus musculus]